jgi:hypothetical protein
MHIFDPNASSFAAPFPARKPKHRVFTRITALGLSRLAYVTIGTGADLQGNEKKFATEGNG